jgi:hypothetical protein
VSHLRFAACVCVLAICLLVGGAGGAIAAAEPGSPGSVAHGHGDAAGSSPSGSAGIGPSTGLPGNTATGPAGGPADALRNTVRGITSKLDLSGKARPQPSRVANRANVPGGNGIADTKNDVGRLAMVPDPVAQAPNGGATVANGSPPDANGGPPDANGQGRALGVGPAATNVFEPVTNSVTDLVALVPGPIATPVATGTDVIAALVGTLTSVASGVVQRLQQYLSEDLSALFNIAAALQRANSGANVVDTPGGTDAGLGIAADLPVLVAPSSASQSPLVPLLLPDVAGVPLAGNATAAASLGETATTYVGREESSLVGTATLAPPSGESVMGLRLPFGKTFGEILVAASLAALAAVALPGVSGLVFSAAAGVGVGYRQAKTDIALRTEGVARFARRGPLGVVRSASMVVIIPRAQRVQGLLDIDNVDMESAA